jgi:hypothetical protein
LDGDLMPRGPKGEKRPADVIGNAVNVHADRAPSSGSGGPDDPLIAALIQKPPKSLPVERRRAYQLVQTACDGFSADLWRRTINQD